MKRHYHDADYVYLAARLCALEKTALTDERLSRVIDAPTFDEAFGYVRDAYGESADTPYETVLADALANAYAFAEDLLAGTPGDFEKPLDLPTPFRYVYDCQNLKSAVKCDARGASAASMLSRCASRPPEKALDAVQTRDFGAFPAHMSHAASSSFDELAASGDGAIVDKLLDRAVFADMLDKAQELSMPYLTALIRCRIDTVNIVTALRCIRSGGDKTVLLPLLIDGGTLDSAFFAAHYAETPDAFLASLAVTDYASLSDVKDASQAQKLCDVLYLEKAREAKRKPFGAQWVLCYLVEKEAEVRNVRIALSFKAAGLSPDRIRASLRVKP